MNKKSIVELDITGIDSVLELMHQKYQFDLFAFDRAFISKSIDRRKSDLGIQETISYAEYLNANEAEAKKLFGSLTITYTQFFRDPLTFAFLEQTVLPSLLANKKEGSEFRVWSAGCSTGQEAYSLAILLTDLAAVHGNKWHFRIFATDNCDAALAVAKQGVYDSDALQNLRLKQWKHHFQKNGDGYIVHPNLKRVISFTKYDLLDPASCNPPESIYGDFDLILCCNLLIYYSQERQQFIVDKFFKSLSSTGVLVSGEAERGLMERRSGLPILTPQVPVFKRNSFDDVTPPLWRNSL